MTRQITDAVTGEVTIVELTEEEVAELEALAIEEAERKANLQAKAEARLALLERLGLSEEEAALLLG